MREVSFHHHKQLHVAASDFIYLYSNASEAREVPDEYVAYYRKPAKPTDANSEYTGELLFQGHFATEKRHGLTEELLLAIVLDRLKHQYAKSPGHCEAIPHVNAALSLLLGDGLPPDRFGKLKVVTAATVEVPVMTIAPSRYEQIDDKTIVCSWANLPGGLAAEAKLTLVAGANMATRLMIVNNVLFCGRSRSHKVDDLQSKWQAWSDLEQTLRPFVPLGAEEWAVLDGIATTAAAKNGLTEMRQSLLQHRRVSSPALDETVDEPEVVKKSSE